MRISLIRWIYLAFKYENRRKKLVEIVHRKGGRKGRMM
jgi:hypothetical protein